MVVKSEGERGSCEKRVFRSGWVEGGGGGDRCKRELEGAVEDADAGNLISIQADWRDGVADVQKS